MIGAEFERILALQWERVIPEPAPSVIAVARRFADQAGLAIEQAARRRAQDETRALQAVTEALSAAATPAEVGSAIVRQGVAALGARAATVYALAEDGEGVELVASEGYSTEMISAWERIPLNVQTPVTDAIRTREVVVCACFEEIVGRYPWFERTDESFVAVPLIAAGRAIGSVFIGSPEERLHGADLDVVVGLARQAAQALDRAQLFEREQASVNRLRKLQAVTASLSKAVTVEDVSRTCLEHAATGVGASAGLIVLRHPGTGHGTSTIAVVAAIGSELKSDEIPEAAAAAITSCLRERRPAGSDMGWVAFPLADGALAVQSPARRGFAGADREWLQTLASQGAQALDRAGRYEAERGIAETLQRSVLPERLPTVSGITLAARYLPGSVGVDVGGDWYDAIQLEDGRVGLVIGDVVGKGVQAAAMMGQLRNACARSHSSTLILVRSSRGSAGSSTAWWRHPSRRWRISSSTREPAASDTSWPAIRRHSSSLRTDRRGSWRGAARCRSASTDRRASKPATAEARGGIDHHPVHRRPRRASRQVARRGPCASRELRDGKR